MAATRAAVRAMMASLDAVAARFDIDAAALADIRADFDAFSVSEAETSARNRAALARGAIILLDPHTAVGDRRGAARGGAARDRKRRSSRSAPPIAAKFPDAIEAATGAASAPCRRISPISLNARSIFRLLPNDQREIERFIRDAALAPEGRLMSARVTHFAVRTARRHRRHAAS